MLKKLAVAACLACLPAIACAAPDLSGLAFDQRIGATLPLSVSLADEAGRTTNLAEISAGLPLVLAFGYTRCPGFCGVVRDDAFAALSHTSLVAGRDYRFVFVSIDPAESPADAAAAKASDMLRTPTAGAGTGWRFLTGTAPSLDAVEQAAGFRTRYDPALKQFFHPAGLLFATPQGVISGYVMGVGYKPGDVRAALLRAKSGEIGQAASQVLLLCFHFDPLNGQYTLAITKLLRLAGALTVVAIGGIVILAQRRAAAA